eukprot:210265-Pelagomonas_calceolata.AAC.6
MKQPSVISYCPRLQDQTFTSSSISTLTATPGFKSFSCCCRLQFNVTESGTQLGAFDASNKGPVSMHRVCVCPLKVQDEPCAFPD